MNRIITEDIIRRAINESIDEFMLEEALGGWGGLKNWANKTGITNAAKNAWNGIKMYMDYRTNGQWNNKYGQYANGNGKMTELYYLNKWFNFHLKEVQSIAYYMQNPNNAQGEIEWRYNEKGEKVGTQKINRYNDIKEYALKNITPQNFNNWVGNFVKNREAVNAIDSYLKYCTTSVKDINSANKLLSIDSFMSSKAGQYYLSLSNEQLKKRQENQDWNRYYRSRQNSGAYGNNNQTGNKWNFHFNPFSYQQRNKNTNTNRQKSLT